MLDEFGCPFCSSIADDNPGVEQDLDLEQKVPFFVTGSGVIDMPGISVGAALEATQQVVLRSVATKEEHVYAEPGDLCIVTSVYKYGISIGSYQKWWVDIMFFDGNSMSMSVDGINQNFKVLKKFPRRLSDMKRYKEN